MPVYITRSPLVEVADVVEQIFTIAMTVDLSRYSNADHEAACRVYQAIHEVTETRMRDVLRGMSLLASREIRGMAMGAHLMRIYDRHWRPIEPEGGVLGRHRHARAKRAKNCQ